MNDQMALIWCWFWFRFYFSQSCVSDRTMQRSYSTENRQTSSPPRRRHWTTSSSATPNAVSSMTYYSLELFQHIFAETRKRRIFSFDVWYWQWHNRLRVPSDFFATFCLLFCSPAGILVHETSRYLWCHCSYLHRSLWSLNPCFYSSTTYESQFHISTIFQSFTVHGLDYLHYFTCLQFLNFLRFLFYHFPKILIVLWPCLYLWMCKILMNSISSALDIWLDDCCHWPSQRRSRPITVMNAFT